MSWRARVDTGGGLYPQLWIQLLLNGGLRNCIFPGIHMFPGDADAAGVGTPLWGPAALGGKDQSEKKTEGYCEDCWVVARESEAIQESMLSWKSGEDSIFFFFSTKEEWSAVLKWQARYNWKSGPQTYCSLEICWVVILDLLKFPIHLPSDLWHPTCDPGCLPRAFQVRARLQIIMKRFTFQTGRMVGPFQRC